MNKMLSVISFFLLLVISLFAQESEEKNKLSESTFSGLKFRSIGPALMSGRIADIAIHPKDYSTWYIAVGSGGVWKTTNSGTTWDPIFDNEISYSIGCVTIDANNPNIVWVGTGENVGGRHVGYGDGIYKSSDGGNSWKNMGLKGSEHISKIIVHPDNPDVVWVAAQGPLWVKGGERGLYKTTNSGENWNKVLGDNEWIGVTDIVIDSRNPDVLYAATWQRHRNVAAYMGGGPGSGIHKSTDGGETWDELKKGLPNSNMGKIGLAISPQNPDVIYAVIELDRREGGVYKSTDRGESWAKQSDAVTGGTGPHYYQEIAASPHKFDLIYLIDVRIQVSEDGGKTFDRMSERHKHSDNHAMAFRPDDPDYLLVGTDGGLYESFDKAENWKYIANLPVTQFYKVAVDDAEPFYFVYGGTQDNNSQGGPSRTDNLQGIQNSDWFITLYADGHQSATEPGNPNIIYAEWQQGNLCRIDRTTGEIIYIQPQPEAEEPYERFNWDSPILISPHKPSRIYFASQRVWKSEDRGDSWTPISGDLTLNQDRITLPIMGKTWSWDSPWDFVAMSTYNTITSLAESPLQEGLIYAGTDDGRIQITENGGKNWKLIEVNKLPGCPATAFINDIKADLFDVNTVYAALDNHKFGDLNPYLYKSTDRGETWKSIVSNIPERTLIWRMVQDYVNPKLLFSATEFGIYFSIDGGQKWVKLKGGLPTISFRDLVIQKRENDLVCASFGRGFYILDDYSLFRDITEEQLYQEASMFPIRKAWWYIPRPAQAFSPKGSLGAQHYVADNPPFGAVFTYYLAESLITKESERKKEEKKLLKEKKDVSFPGWDKIEDERRQEKPKIWLTVKDDHGNVVKKIEGKTNKGFHRVAWDLKYSSTHAISLESGSRNYEPDGMMVAPGNYSVTLSKQIDGDVTELSKPVYFEVERLYKGVLEGADPKETAAFWQEIAALQKETSAASTILRNADKKLDAMRKALLRTQTAPGDLEKQLHDLQQKVYDLDERLNGNRSRRSVGEKIDPTINSRIGVASTGTTSSTYGPTPTHKRSLEIAKIEFKEFKPLLKNLVEVEIPKVEKALIEAGAPWLEGQPVPEE